MNLLEGAAIATVIVVAVQIIFPGRDLYHAGWFNVTLATLAVTAVLSARKPFAQSKALAGKIAAMAVVFGVAIAGLAGVASGLLGPDNRTIVGAPGQRVRADDLNGSLNFPLAQAETANATPLPIVLERPGHAPLAILNGARDAGTFILRPVPRTVVYVEARDARGGTLTVTQPSGTSFLSPVLLMQQRQTIGGMDLPYDSFAVPATHRMVKAVLFTSQQAAQLRGMAGTSRPAVLFAVDDERDRPLPHGLVLASDGQTVEAGGIALRGVVLSYPAVEVVSAPALSAVIAAALLIAGGLIATRLPQERTA
jgi:hypothetical protein